MDDAVCMLIKGKLRMEEKYSGEAYFFTFRMMDKFMIVSDGKIYLINKFCTDVLLAYVDTKGTILYVDLLNYSHKVTADIFGLYADYQKL